MDEFYYVTKYALTTGVLMVRRDKAELFADGTMLSWFSGGYFNDYAHGKGRDWHETKEDAEIRVKEIKERKAMSLRKIIQKLGLPTKFVEVKHA